MEAKGPLLLVPLDRSMTQGMPPPMGSHPESQGGARRGGGVAPPGGKEEKMVRERGRVVHDAALISIECVESGGDVEHVIHVYPVVGFHGSGIFHDEMDGEIGSQDGGGPSNEGKSEKVAAVLSTVT